MQKFIACLLLMASLGIISPLLSAQQNQTAQKSDSEIEALKKRISELEKQLQAVENVEKLDLQAKLADANAKLANAEFGKFQRGLRNSNDDWLRKWGSLFANVIGVFVAVSGIVIIVVGGIFWSWFKSKTDSFIADEVEKSLNGFKEAVDQVEEMKDELRLLKKDHAASMLMDFHRYFDDIYPYPERINAVSEEDLLGVFDDEIYDIEARYAAAEVLADRKSPRLVFVLLEFINSAANSNSNLEPKIEDPLCGYVGILGQMHTQEVYQGLTEFLNRLLAGDPRQKEVLLTWTAFSLATISVELNERDSISILKRSMPYLNTQQDPRPIGRLGGGITKSKGLTNLARFFDRYNEPESIKEILTKHVTSGMRGLENRCLESLQKYDPDFAEEWGARQTTDNSEA